MSGDMQPYATPLQVDALAFQPLDSSSSLVLLQLTRSYYSILGTIALYASD